MNLRRTITAVLAAALLLPSCAAPVPEDDPSENPDIIETAGTNTQIPTVSAIPLAAASKEPEGIPADETLKSAVTGFSEAFYKLAIQQTEENVILSPLSLYYALALTTNGAVGETKTEMESALGLSTDELNGYLCALTEKLGETENSTVNIANSVWGNSSIFQISPDFRTIAEKYYSTEAKSVQFGDPETVGEINNWVSGKTDGMIPRVVDELDPGLALILLNTVLFDGVWQKEYEEWDVRPDSFHAADGTIPDVDFLCSTESGYFTVDGAVGFSKNYSDSYRFIGVLPDGDVNDFTTRMDLSEIIEKSAKSYAECDAAIPKFEYETSLGLNEIAQSLGIQRAFTDFAELGGLSATGVNDLYISSIFQKAKVILNEHGTKAAAATEIAVAEEGYAILPTVYLDRPFFFVIVDSDGIPLFLGTVENPTA